MRKSNIRAMAISCFVIALSAFNFSNLKGGECIRSIHVVTLLVCGMGIGLFLTSLFGGLINKKKEVNVD